MSIPKILDNLPDQYKKFVAEIKKNNRDILIGTLGPKGTSANYSLEYLCKTLKNEEKIDNLIIYLKESFNKVFESLEKGDIDYAFIPNAYERITDYYWYPGFKNVFNFLYAPPPYGLISKKTFGKDSLKKRIRIASCSAVNNILLYLDKDYFSNYEKVEVSSTIETAKAVVEGLADIGITNMTSFKKYEECGLKLISDKFYAEVVFTVFKKRTEREGKKIIL